ncbi:MAG: hypothetical protein ACD_10C00894G0001 [uncultured bacterium]|nr:MAG: hypothetical protein ACD_10C00894G0001 [uncultured bacterium]
MKKLMSVLVLVAFIGSMVVMTGCFGGSDGIGAILGGILIIAIVASGPAGGVAFAANTRADYRAAITGTASTKYVARVTATGQAPVEVTAIKVDVNKISFEDVSLNASSNGQYLVEIFPAGYTATTAPIFKYYFTKTVAAGATVDDSDTPYPINASHTAEALIYDAWTGSTTTTIDHVVFNSTNVDDLSKRLEVELNTLVDSGIITVPTTFDWSATADVLATTGAGNVTTAYIASGYVYAADGTGQSDCMVYVYSDAAMTQMVNHFSTTNGTYTATGLANGTYYFKPVKDLHTYTPVSTQVVINGADKSGINFQAARVQ